MQIEGKVGVQNLSDGAVGLFRLDRYGALVANARLSEAALAGRLFGVANQAAVATTAALTGTWTGLCVSNPAASGKNMHMRQFGFSQTVAGSADGAVGLLTCTIAAPASNVTIQNQKIGGATSSMIADDGATIVSPALQRVFGSIGTVAVTAYGTETVPPFDIDGIIIPPGYTIGTYTTKATTASLIFFFVWEEIDA
jgi:hypothetical protein